MNEYELVGRAVVGFGWLMIGACTGFMLVGYIRHLWNDFKRYR